uniref:Uncharacterized protein n=1 Tax=viral metagenome TaxID=1070528 RepID=A0A6M3KAW7_9ZZZZ
MKGGLNNPRVIDALPVNGNLNNGISSDWAFDHAADLDAHTLNPAEQVQTGAYNFFNYGTNNAQVLGADVLWGTIIWIPRALTVDRIAIDVTAGAAGKIAYVGIYNVGANLTPGSLLIDGGSISVAAVTVVAATVSQALTKGYYYVAVVSDGTPTIRSILYSAWSPLGYPTTNFSGTNSGYYKAASGCVANAGLVDPFTAGSIAAAGVPKVLLRVASLD